MALSREELLQQLELKREAVELSGGSVTVSELSGPDYLDTANSPLIKDEKGEFNGVKFYALMVARCVVDEDGNRLFSDEDAAILPNKSRVRYSKLCKAMERVNGLDGDEGKNA